MSLLPYAPTNVIEPVTTVYLASTVVSSVSVIPPGSMVIVPMLFTAASSAYRVYVPPTDRLPAGFVPVAQKKLGTYN